MRRGRVWVNFKNLSVFLRFFKCPLLYFLQKESQINLWNPKKNIRLEWEEKWESVAWRRGEVSVVMEPVMRVTLGSQKPPPSSTSLPASSPPQITLAPESPQSQGPRGCLRHLLKVSQRWVSGYPQESQSSAHLCSSFYSSQLGHGQLGTKDT